VSDYLCILGLELAHFFQPTNFEHPYQTKVYVPLALNDTLLTVYTTFMNLKKLSDRVFVFLTILKINYYFPTQH
jgi:hypothetical protein